MQLGAARTNVKADRIRCRNASAQPLHQRLFASRFHAFWLLGIVVIGIVACLLCTLLLLRFLEELPQEEPWDVGVFPAAAIGAAGATSDGRSEGFTMVLNTFRRDPCLEQAIQHWLGCHPRQLRVAWNDAGRPLPRFLEEAVRRANGRLVIDEHSTSNLTNRFLPLDFPTQAVFSVDDDLIFSCAELWAQYAVWQKHRGQLVGLAPRLLHKSPDACEIWAESYHHWGLNRANTVLITKGGFVHRRFYEAYFAPELADLRAAVNAHRNGEDLLMAFVHASSAAPVSASQPVPVFSSTLHNLDCVQKTMSRPLNDYPGSERTRCSQVERFAAWFGWQLRTAHYDDFYLFNNATGHAENLGAACSWNKLWGLSPLWWLCVNRVFREKGRHYRPT